MPKGEVKHKVQEMRCDRCDKIIGFIWSVYRGNYHTTCPSCYFDGWKNQEKDKKYE